MYINTYSSLIIEHIWIWYIGYKAYKNGHDNTCMVMNVIEHVMILYGRKNVDTNIGKYVHDEGFRL